MTGGLADTQCRHEAFLYRSEAELGEITFRFLREAVEHGEPVFVGLPPSRSQELRQRLGTVPDGVVFARDDLQDRNPACLVPAWQAFLDRHRAAGRCRGIGDPVVAGSDPGRRAACQRHEELVNLAFADCPFWLLCPYDLARAGPADLAGIQRSHPLVCRGGRTEASETFPGNQVLAADKGAPLPLAPPDATTLDFDAGGLSEVRHAVSRFGGEADLGPGRTSDLVLAANEVATNSVRYGGGRGTALLWAVGGAVHCQFEDDGHIEDPLVGLRRPAADCPSGRGLWIANHTCDLVEIRDSDRGTVVRLRMDLDGD